MNEYEKKIREYMQINKIDAKHLIFEQTCHSVPEAAAAANAEIDEFVKNICMIGSSGNLIVAIVKGEDRASTSRVAKALECERPRIANADEMLEKSGYPCGGTPSFGYSATFLIDERVMEKEIVYSGGGSQKSLIKISTKELLRANQGKVMRIRK
jgi:prolyl-tRNA editing enzyme YbaK/EbsC (Cys-tRNA(Pro) deacylase)